jgi:hypothetical protein
MQDITRNIRPSLGEIIVIGTVLLFFALTAFVRP